MMNSQDEQGRNTENSLPLITQSLIDELKKICPKWTFYRFKRGVFNGAAWNLLIAGIEDLYNKASLQKKNEFKETNKELLESCKERIRESHTSGSLPSPIPWELSLFYELNSFLDNTEKSSFVFSIMNKEKNNKIPKLITDFNTFCTNNKELISSFDNTMIFDNTTFIRKKADYRKKLAIVSIYNKMIQEFSELVLKEQDSNSIRDELLKQVDDYIRVSPKDSPKRNAMRILQSYLLGDKTWDETRDHLYRPTCNGFNKKILYSQVNETVNTIVKLHQTGLFKPTTLEKTKEIDRRNSINMHLRSLLDQVGQSLKHRFRSQAEKTQIKAVKDKIDDFLHESCEWCEVIQVMQNSPLHNKSKSLITALDQMLESYPELNASLSATDEKKTNSNP